MSNQKYTSIDCPAYLRSQGKKWSPYVEVTEKMCSNCPFSGKQCDGKTFIKMSNWQETVIKTTEENCHNTLEERLSEQAKHTGELADAVIVWMSYFAYRKAIQDVIDFLRGEVATTEERSAGEARLKAHFNAMEKVILGTVVFALKEWLGPSGR